MATNIFGAAPPIVARVNATASSGTASLKVNSPIDQGTLPTLSGGQQFAVVINPNTSGLLDHTNTASDGFTERAIVTAIAGPSAGAYTFTLSANLANTHQIGEFVVIVVTADELNAFLQQTGTFGAGGNFTGAIDMGGNQIKDGAIGTSPSDFTVVSQLPSTVPVVSSLIDFGHSYLGGYNNQTDEPMTQATSFLSRVAGMFHVPDQHQHDIATAGAVLIGNGGPTLAGWDAVLARVLPPQATGLAGFANNGLGETKVLQFSVPAVFPSTAQPPAVVMHGVNDLGLVMPFQTASPPPVPHGLGSYAASTFVGNISGAGATSITSSTNLSSTGSFLANRVGGAGIQVGDLITGPGLSTQLGARVTAISWNGSTTTTITVSASATTATESGQTYTVYCGQYGQAATALQHCYETVISRLLAGAVIRSDDTSSSLGFFFTYTGGTGGGASWTTQQQWDNTWGWLGHTGPSIRQVAQPTGGVTTNASFTVTLPANFPGGVVTIVAVGGSDLDSSGSIITWSGAAAHSAPTTAIGGQGFAGFTVPVITRFVCTAADAGNAITGTFSNPGSGTATLQIDSASIDATYEAPVMLCNQPSGCTIANPTTAAAIDYAIVKAVRTFTNTNSGLGVNQCGIPNTYGHVARVDFWDLMAKRGFWLGNSLNSTDATDSANIVGQHPCLTVASCITTNASTSVTVASGGFPGVSIGMVVVGAGIAAGTTVTAVSVNTLTLSQNATASATVSLGFFAISSLLPPYVNQTLIMSASGGTTTGAPQAGGLYECLLITALGATSFITIGGVTYPRWFVTMTRNSPPTIGSGAKIAAQGAIGHNAGSGIDLTTLSSTTLTVAVDQPTSSGLFAAASSTVLGYATCLTSSNGVSTRAVISYTGTTTTGGTTTALTGCNLVSGGGTLAANGVIAQTALDDLMWTGPDLVHPGEGGAATMAGLLLTQYLAVFNSDTTWEAASNQTWTQKRSRTPKRPLFHGYWTNRGFSNSATTTMGTQVWAIPFVVPELVIVKDMSIWINAASTAVTHQLMYAGIAIPAAGGSYPGLVIEDFGLTASTTAATLTSNIGGLDLNSGASAGVWNVIAQGHRILPPGEYWALFGTASGGSGQATFHFLARSHGEMTNHVDVANALNQTLTNVNPQIANMPVPAGGGVAGASGWNATYPAGNISGNTLLNLAPLASSQNPYNGVSTAYGNVGQWNTSQGVPAIAIRMLGHSIGTAP